MKYLLIFIGTLITLVTLATIAMTIYLLVVVSKTTTTSESLDLQQRSVGECLSP